jgi:ferredoxin
MARVRAVVDHDLCAGVAMCTQTAPGAFALNDEGLSEYRDGPWPATDLADAADACPMAAILIAKNPTPSDQTEAGSPDRPHPPQK